MTEKKRMSMKIFFLKNKYILYHILFVAGLIILDQLSKHFSLYFPNTISNAQFLGFSLSEPIKNYNLIFGFDFGMNPLLILSYLTAIFCLFLFCYILSFIFIPKALWILQTGISLLFAGFTGNFLSKVLLSYNTDFIKWSFSQKVTIYFNLSDIFQTLAFIIIFLQVILLRKILWRAKERRSQFLVIKNYQIQFISYCVLAFICFSLFFLLLNYQFFSFISPTEFPNIDKLSEAFFSYSSFSLFFFVLFITLFFGYLSHKIYGPIYAFERYVRSLLRGEQVQDLQLRKNDQLKHLEKLARDIKKSLGRTNRTKNTKSKVFKKT